MPASRRGLVRAAVLVAPGRFELRHQMLEPLRSGHLRIAVEGSGVSGASLPVWEGRPWCKYPLSPGAPGHEGWGRVQAVGDGVRKPWKEGVHAAFLHDSVFADVVDVPVDDAVALPAVLGSRPFPGEAIGSAFNIVARSGITTESTVCVVGVGFIGALMVMLATKTGAHVIAISRRAFALDMAKELGAATTVQFRDNDMTEETVGRLTDGQMCDVVIEATGTQEGLDLASRLTRVRGRLVIAGYHQDGLRTVDMEMWNWRGIDVVNAHERDPALRRRGIEAAATAVASGVIDPSVLYTHRFPLDRLGDAMSAMSSRPHGFLKALVHM